jgi:hypothetical protein
MVHYPGPRARHRNLIIKSAYSSLLLLVCKTKVLCIVGQFPTDLNNSGQQELRPGQEALCAEVEMKLVLLVLVALGLTMAWQASVVADNDPHKAGLNVAIDPASSTSVILSQRD